MEVRNFDVVALGELLIDFTENGESGQGNPLFEANPGGAPCNVLARLGKRCAFIGKVGNDMFGTQLRIVAGEAGICMDALAVDSKFHTTLAFVKTFENGDRDFSFYRNPGADMMLAPEDVPEDMVKDAQIFHFGTLSLTHEPARSATQKAVALAKKARATIEVNEMLGSEVNLHARSDDDEVVMVIPTVDLKTDVSMGAKVNFTTQPRLIQLFDKATGNNLIWYDKESAKANAPVCKSYNF